MNWERILVLAPHTDDAELGCGGTLSKLINKGVHVHVAAFSTAEESLPENMPPDTLEKEFIEAMSVIGIPKENLIIYNFKVRHLSYSRQEALEEIIKLKTEICPDTVFLPSCHDLHQDHQVVHAEGMRAFKDTSVLAYELPWNHIRFDAQGFIRLSKEDIYTKLSALQCYKSQLKKNREYMSKSFIEGLAKVRGTQIKCEWAEAFEVMRIICCEK